MGKIKVGSKFNSADNRKIKNLVILKNGNEYKVLYNSGATSLDIMCKHVKKRNYEFFKTLDISECASANEVVNLIKKAV